MRRTLGFFLFRCILALSLLWGGQAALAASQAISNPVTSTHCAKPNTDQHSDQLPAPNCLAHCALPAQTSTSSPTAHFAQVWQAGLIASVSERNIAPPSPPPKFSAV